MMSVSVFYLNLKSTLFKYCPNCGADMRGDIVEN